MQPTDGVRATTYPIFDLLDSGTSLHRRGGSSMSNEALREGPVAHLNAALRGELTAVSQYFIHILVLRAWGDPESARGLEPVNDADFPNAMRIVDHVLAGKALPELCAAGEPFARHLPVVGDDRLRMLAADLELERRLLETLGAARAGLEGSGDPIAQRLVADAESRRRPHIAWLEAELGARAGPSDGHPSFPSGDAAASLNGLLAHLIVALEQALVHAFVAWHAGERSLADALWTISYGAMIHATSIVDLFGAEKTAPSFVGAAAFDDLECPRVASDFAQVVALERGVASRCRRRAETAAGLVADGAANAVCREAVAHFDRIAGWLETGIPPVSKFPGNLRSFQRLREAYVD
jgi:bacterioferritin (cytochrome b1)